jgi:hypothetical protein
MKLVINLAACSGVFGTTMLRPDFGPAPFRGLIGPRRELDETEVLASVVSHANPLSVVHALSKNLSLHFSD